VRDFFDGATTITHLELLSAGRVDPGELWPEFYLRAVGSLPGVKVLAMAKGQLEVKFFAWWWE
jgi:hypothetical protein